MRTHDEKNIRAKHWLKIGAWLMGIALLLFVGLFIFTNWLQHKLEQSVQKQSKGVYRLAIFGFQVSPFAGTLSADSLSLVPDYSRWHALQSQHQEVSRTLLDLQTNTLQLRGINFFSILIGQDVKLSLVEVGQPHLLMTTMREDTTAQHKPFHETVTGIMHGLAVDKIDVNDARLEYRKSPGAAESIFSIQRFNLTIADFQLDSQSFQAQDRAYYANGVILAATNAAYLFSEGDYRLSTDSLYLNTERRSLLAKQLKLNPTSDPASLARRKGKAVSFTKLEVPEVSISGLNYPEHSRHSNFMAQHLLITNPQMSSFKDKQRFENKGRQPLPHELVQQMQTKFLLDSVEVLNGYFRYAELVPKAAERGHINVQNLNITLLNLSNIPQHMSDKKPAIAHVNGVLMGKVPVQLSVYMPLLNKNGYHRIEGKIASGNPEVLNAMVAPTAFVRFESGYVSRGSFEVELNEERATGKLHLLYSNFKIDLLSKGTGGEQSFGKEVLSKLANWLVIKQSNPDDKGEVPRVGNINVTRNPENSVFGYWKDCLLDGFMSIAGLAGRAEKL